MSYSQIPVISTERRDASLLQKICNSLALVPIANREKKFIQSFKYVLRRWWSMLSMSRSERSIYLITCTYCVPGFWSPGNDENRFWPDLSELNPDCVFCNILLQAYYSSVRGTARELDLISMTLGSVDIIDQGMVRPVYSWENTKGHVEELFVGLYSEELHNRHNPFPVAKVGICQDPTSAQMLSKIQSWIASCVATHHDCTIFNKSIPKRLIKLDGDACLRSPETPVRYAALSYCWGSFKQPTTTKANVAIRYNHLNISNLPQTLKDAVVMTRKLGIDYLWIDSICIVQDDEDDWATESAKMGDLYSNAYVVLAATGASNVAEGFLNIRQAHSITARRGSNHSFTLQARVVNNHGFIEQTRLSQFPLFKRGWTMQERLLATRTVHFLPDEVLYECKTSTRCECGTKNDSTLNQITWPPKEKPHNPRWSHELEFSREWANIVSDYSKRHLTYANDVLPALSGIARRTLSIQPGKYIAGMWEKGIAFQLSWHTTEPTKDNDVSGPTFSWIKCRTPISFPVFHVPEWPICTLLSAGSTPTTSDPFGRITQAFIRLQGRAIQGSDLVNEVINSRTRWYHDRKKDPGYMRIYLDTGLAYDHRQHVPDIETTVLRIESLLDWSRTMCFGLFEGSSSVAMLLLQRGPEQGSLVRVGVVHVFPKMSFDKHATECSVTVV